MKKTDSYLGLFKMCLL